MIFWFLAGAFIILLVAVGIAEWRERRESMRALRDALRWDGVDDLLLDIHLRRGPYDHQAGGDFDG